MALLKEEVKQQLGLLKALGVRPRVLGNRSIRFLVASGLERLRMSGRKIKSIKSWSLLRLMDIGFTLRCDERVSGYYTQIFVVICQ